MTPLPLRLSAWLYGASLRLLPRSFRSAFGADLATDFAALAAASHERRGVASVAWLTTRGVADVAWMALRERIGGDEGNLSGPWRTPRGRRARPGETTMQWLRDMRQAARALAARPGFTLAAVLTLGLGIGATVAIFAVVDAVLIRPLPYPESDRVVQIRHHAPGIELANLENSHGTVDLYRTRARSFSAVALVEGGSHNLTGAEVPARITALHVSPSFFDVLRTQPRLGRRFVEGEGARGGAAPAILMHGAWRTRFGAAPDVIGRTIELDGVTTEIVGVMPEGFAYGDQDAELLLAQAIDTTLGYTTFGRQGIARLAPGVTVAQAQAEVSRLQPLLSSLRPDDLPAEFMKNAGWSASVERLRDVQVRDVRSALWIVLGTVTFVLLIACANVANLFLVRAEGRQRETAIRAALGASGPRVAWSFLAESLLLGLAGGAAGTAVATVAVRALVAAGPAELPRLAEVSVDVRALLFALLLSVISGLLFGMLPLPRQLRTAAGALREARGDTGSRERHRMRHALIAAQVALALVLLTGSGLMLRSFQRLRSVDPGVRTDNVLTLGVSYGARGDAAAAARFYQQAIEQVQALPGVVSAAATNSLPISPDGINGGSFDIESMPREDEEIPPVAMWVAVTTGFFETLAMPVVRGRTMGAADDVPHANAVWVNEEFVRMHLPGRDPLRERVRIGGEDQPWRDIGGVVGDVRTFGLAEAVSPMVYVPAAISGGNLSIELMHLVVHTSVPPTSVLPSVRAAVARADGQVPLTTARTMTDVLRESIASTSFMMAVLGIAAVVALLLGAIGLYGVIAYVVAQRTRELGVRLALGAPPARVGRMVLGQGLAVVAVGAVIGLGGALALTRLMRGVLFEVPPFDPVTYAAVLLLLVAMSLLAAWLPARRAARIDVVAALHAD